MNFLNFILLSLIFSFPVYAGSGYNSPELCKLSSIKNESLKKYDTQVVNEFKKNNKRNLKAKNCVSNFNHSLTLKFAINNKLNVADSSPTFIFSFEKELNKILISKLLI
ncbi:MAG TPA: hypothetical protein PLG90_11125 [Ignavibacteria bacterium]|nr:hypothetical protein [Ignavibacteria bacterium]